MDDNTVKKKKKKKKTSCVQLSRLPYMLTRIYKREKRAFRDIIHVDYASIRPIEMLYLCSKRVKGVNVKFVGLSLLIYGRFLND